MDEDWWPDMMRGLAREDPWGEEMVTVAEMRGYDDAIVPGQRILWSALVTTEDLASLDGELRAFNHEVESTGRPGPESAGQLKPRFHVSAYHEGRRIECEPLILGWTQANQTALVLDPGFAMTYGLMPRAGPNGAQHWDDPAAPQTDIAIVDEPSLYDSQRVSGARARISRGHLQDYLTLRGMHLIQVYYEYRSAFQDDAAEQLLGAKDKDRVCEDLRDRSVDVSRYRDGEYVTQVWGARLIAGPGDMPVTSDTLEREGLVWPGLSGPVTRDVARKARMHDWVYVRDTVLAIYEDRPGFSVHPESGAVSFKGQWSVGHCERVGRDVIRVELKKLYEGTPHRVIRHWHAHAIQPTPAVTGPRARQARNIASRAKALVQALTKVGELLAELNDRLELPELSGADLVGLDREFLEYNGWWMGPFVKQVARHAPIDMGRDAFLERCLDLDKLTIEALAERHLRRMVQKIGEPRDRVKDLRGLKLLDRIACLAQVATDAGLSLSDAGAEIVHRFHEDARSKRPLNHLFVISDLRQLKGHRKEIEAGAITGLERLGMDERAVTGGWGPALDALYDGAINDLETLCKTLADAVAIIHEGG